jgi:hypothetical protein
VPGDGLPQAAPGGVPEGRVVVVAPKVVEAVFEDGVVERRQARRLLQGCQPAIDPVGEGRRPPRRLPGGGGERPQAGIGDVGLPVVPVAQGLGIAQVRPVDEIEGDRLVAAEVAPEALSDGVGPPASLFLAGRLVGETVDADE